MSIALSDDPVVISLAKIPTSGADDFCHIVAAPPGTPFGDRALCGYKATNEDWCCETGLPKCGRPKCPECQYVWETEWA